MMETMTFALLYVLLERNIVFLKLRHQLLGLTDIRDHILSAVDDEQRHLDSRDMLHRGNLIKSLPVLFGIAEVQLQLSIRPSTVLASLRLFYRTFPIVNAGYHNRASIEVRF